MDGEKVSILESTAQNNLRSSQNVRWVRSEEIFQKDRLIMIEHEGKVYRLLKTKKNKLILN